VLPEVRGRGLGVELVREVVENGAFTGVKWLHATDAHGLYEPFGFGRPDAKVMERLP
jgi:predicted N-acetyltransferase YhbS